MKLHEAKINILDGSIEISDRGMITGIIYVDFEDVKFPDSGWRDCVVVILTWWLEALVPLVQGSALSIDLRFMEGPLRMSIRRSSSLIAELRCIRGSKLQVPMLEVCSLSFLKSVLVAARQVRLVCLQKDLRSKDVMRLNAAIEVASSILDHGV